MTKTSTPTERTIDLTTDDGVPVCGCGCRQTPSGKKSAFIQGHDARFKGVLIRAHRAGEPIVVVDDQGKRSVPAMELAAQRGWEHYLLHEPKKASSKSAGSSKKATRQVKIQVGRWTYDATHNANGSFTYVNGAGKSVTTTKAKIVS